MDVLILLTEKIAKLYKSTLFSYNKLCMTRPGTYRLCYLIINPETRPDLHSFRPSLAPNSKRKNGRTDTTDRKNSSRHTIDLLAKPNVQSYVTFVRCNSGIVFY
jgi:hypothetical protein